jgi:hypothetical protein
MNEFLILGLVAFLYVLLLALVRLCEWVRPR